MFHSTFRQQGIAFLRPKLFNEALCAFMLRFNILLVSPTYQAFEHLPTTSDHVDSIRWKTWKMPTDIVRYLICTSHYSFSIYVTDNIRTHKTWADRSISPLISVNATWPSVNATLPDSQRIVKEYWMADDMKLSESEEIHWRCGSSLTIGCKWWRILLILWNVIGK